MNQYDFFYRTEQDKRLNVTAKKYVRLIAPSLLEAVELFKTIYEKEKIDVTEVFELL